MQQWPPPKPSDDDEQDETHLDGLSAVQRARMKFNRPNQPSANESTQSATSFKPARKKSIEQQLAVFGDAASSGATRSSTFPTPKLNGVTSLKHHEQKMQTTHREEVMLGPTSSVPLRKGTTDVASSSAESTPPFGTASINRLSFNSMRITEEEDEEEQASDCGAAAILKPESHKEEGWLSARINQVEKLTGIDLDMDGDVGKRGHGRHSSIVESMGSAIASTLSSLSTPAQEDDPPQSSANAQEPSPPKASPLDDDRISGAEREQFGVHVRKAKNVNAASEMKLSTDFKETTPSGAGTFRARQQSTIFSSTTFASVQRELDRRAALDSAQESVCHDMHYTHPPRTCVVESHRARPRCRPPLRANRSRSPRSIESTAPDNPVSGSARLRDAHARLHGMHDTITPSHMTSAECTRSQESRVVESALAQSDDGSAILQEPTGSLRAIDWMAKGADVALQTGGSTAVQSGDTLQNPHTPTAPSPPTDRASTRASLMMPLDISRASHIQAMESNVDDEEAASRLFGLLSARIQERSSSIGNLNTDSATSVGAAKDELQPALPSARLQRAASARKSMVTEALDLDTETGQLTNRQKRFRRSSSFARPQPGTAARTPLGMGRRGSVSARTIRDAAASNSGSGTFRARDGDGPLSYRQRGGDAPQMSYRQRAMDDDRRPLKDAPPQSSRKRSVLLSLQSRMVATEAVHSPRSQEKLIQDHNEMSVSGSSSTSSGPSRTDGSECDDAIEDATPEVTCVMNVSRCAETKPRDVSFRVSNADSSQPPTSATQAPSEAPAAAAVLPTDGSIDALSSSKDNASHPASGLEAGLDTVSPPLSTADDADAAAASAFDGFDELVEEYEDLYNDLSTAEQARHVDGSAAPAAPPASSQTLGIAQSADQDSDNGSDGSNRARRLRKQKLKRSAVNTRSHNVASGEADALGMSSKESADEVDYDMVVSNPSRASTANANWRRSINAVKTVVNLSELNIERNPLDTFLPSCAVLPPPSPMSVQIHGLPTTMYRPPAELSLVGQTSRVSVAPSRKRSAKNASGTSNESRRKRDEAPSRRHDKDTANEPSRSKASSSKKKLRAPIMEGKKTSEEDEPPRHSGSSTAKPPSSPTSQTNSTGITPSSFSNDQQTQLMQVVQAMQLMQSMPSMQSLPLSNLANAQTSALPSNAMAQAVTLAHMQQQMQQQQMQQLQQQLQQQQMQQLTVSNLAQSAHGYAAAPSADRSVSSDHAALGSSNGVRIPSLPLQTNASTSASNANRDASRRPVGRSISRHLLMSQPPNDSADTHAHNSHAFGIDGAQRQASNSNSSNTGPGSSSATAPVVVGRAVTHDLTSSGTNARSDPLESAGASNEEHCAFRVDLYIDDIADNIPAVVVWRFKKGVYLKLTQREPRFKSDRGFYAEQNTACTHSPRHYYGFNVAKLHKVQKSKEVLPLDMSAAVVGGASLMDIVIRVHYDNRGKIRSIFDLVVTVAVSGSCDLRALISARMRLQHQEHVMGERNLQLLALQHPSAAPTMMFTPQLFRNIAMPSIGMTFRGTHRELAKEVWRQLGTLTDRDWLQYQRIRTHFVNEYHQKVSNVIPV